MNLLTTKYIKFINLLQDIKKKFLNYFIKLFLNDRVIMSIIKNLLNNSLKIFIFKFFIFNAKKIKLVIKLQYNA